MLQDKALLIRVKFEAFNPYKRDRHLAEAGAAALGADFAFCNATKRLVPKALYAPIQKCDAETRQFINFNTRPWLDDGWRILATANFFEVMDGLSQRFGQREKLVREFAAEWPNIKQEMQAALGAAYCEDDFPDDIESRFSTDVIRMPIPRSGDFRAEGIDPDDLAKIEADTLKRVQDQFKSTDLWQRVYDSVSHISERLHAYGTDSEGKVVNKFHDTLIENLRDLVAILPKLNIAGDEDLDKMQKVLDYELCMYDPDDLRKDEVIRKTVASKADEILAAVSAFMA